MTALARRAPPLVAALLLAWHFASFEPLTRPLVTDVRYFVYYAWRVTEGDVPHRDLFAVKTPLAIFAGAGLHAAGEALGVDPLAAVRVGSLGLAAAGGLLVFRIHGLLGPGPAAAFLGLLAYLSFGLLGELPAIGNVPKLAMAVAASAAALLCRARRFGAAGAAGALAFLDWQPGALVWLGAVAVALLEPGGRGRAALRVLGGAAGVLAPVGLYFAWHGALAKALGQVLWGSFQRGSDALVTEVAKSPAQRIASSVPQICPEQEWLFWLAVAGTGVVAWRLVRWRREPELRLLLPLAIYHFGIAGFSLLDVQGYGDYMALLHSAAFFLAASFAAALAGARALAGSGLDRVAAPRRGALLRAVPIAAVLLAALGARPGPLRPAIELRSDHARPGATLREQRGVAKAVGRALASRPLAALEGAELLYLLRVSTPLPAPYFNRAVWHAYRLGPEETMLETAERLVLAARPDAVLLPARMVVRGELARDFEPIRYVSAAGRYAVVLRLRRDPGGAGGVSSGGGPRPASP